MAPKAPRPGTTPGRKRAKSSGFKVTIRDQTWILRTADIGPGDDFLVRKQTGWPLSQFLTDTTFGLDSIAVIIWVARRKAGEKKLTWQRVLDEMPSFEEIDELTENDEFELEQLEDIDDEEDGVLPDPLPSGAP